MEDLEFFCTQPCGGSGVQRRITKPIPGIDSVFVLVNQPVKVIWQHQAAASSYGVQLAGDTLQALPQCSDASNMFHGFCQRAL